MITATALSSVDLASLNKGRIIGNALLVGGSLVGMVLGYTHRSLWSVGFVIIGVVWPVIQWKSDTRRALGDATSSALIYFVLNRVST